MIRSFKGNVEIKKALDVILAKEISLADEKTKLIKSIEKYNSENATKIRLIEDERKRIEIHQQFVDSYKRLIRKLKIYRNELPAKLASGLSAKVREFYNIANSHDPYFEKIESITLPSSPGEKINVRFMKDSLYHDVLQIFSEGHIKLLGLCILLSKAVQEDVGFLIYDDLVNAIDDDHRDGVAELLMTHPDLKNRQHILTCHGEQFINRLEHKLGVSLADKEVCRYRFYSADSIDERGVKFSMGDPKHYLLLAKKAFEKDSRKEVASRCRQAIESISEQLWKKLGKELNISLSVKMRNPSARVELPSVIDSLIKEIKKIKGLEELVDCLVQLKKPYIWNLLNKGTHEQEDLPEFERIEVSELLSLSLKIEDLVQRIDLEISCKLKRS